MLQEGNEWNGISDLKNSQTIGLLWMYSLLKKQAAQVYSNQTVDTMGHKGPGHYQSNLVCDVFLACNSTIGVEVWGGEGVGETQLTFCGLELDVICLGGSLWPRTPLVNRKTRISCTRWQPRGTFFCCSLGGRMATTRRGKLRLSLCVRNVACAHAPHHACASRGRWSMWR